MEDISLKLNKELDTEFCANHLQDQAKNYILRKRKSKKKSIIKSIEYPINNRKNGKRVGGWFLCQKEVYFNFLKENFKNYGGLQSKFYKNLAQVIGSRSFKDIKKFHNQLISRFGSIQGIINNYNTKMKLQKCKPNQIQKQSNKKQICYVEEPNKCISSQNLEVKYNSIIKIGELHQNKVQIQKNKTASQMQEEQNICKTETQKQQVKIHTAGFKVIQRSNNAQNQKVIYPFLNINHWLQSAPQLWTYLNPRNILLKRSDGDWLFQ